MRRSDRVDHVLVGRVLGGVIAAAGLPLTAYALPELWDGLWSVARPSPPLALVLLALAAPYGGAWCLTVSGGVGLLLGRRWGHALAACGACAWAVLALVSPLAPVALAPAGLAAYLLSPAVRRAFAVRERWRRAHRASATASSAMTNRGT